jgi:predicted acetyltransferase
MELRLIQDDELPRYFEAMLTTFGAQPEDDPLGSERIAALVEPTRRWAVFDDGEVVATAGAFTQALTIPGGALAAAGLTMVTVRPTHRRRGLLRQLMEVHHAEARARGEILSTLWASEASIYGRFGYGIAAWGLDLRVRADLAQLDTPPPADVTVRLVSVDVARALVPEVHARVAAGRPGVVHRTPAWWHYRVFTDRAVDRGDDSTRRFLIARRGEAVVGYAIVRQKLRMTDAGLPDGKVVIQELLADDTGGEHALWATVLGFDLHPHVEWWNAPIDDALPWRLTNPRQATQHRTDTLWLRLNDVAAALRARRYAGAGDVRLQVDDDAPLDLVTDGAGVATVTHAPAGPAVPTVHLSGSALASCYLGGVAPSTLARAGTVAGDPAAIAMFDRLLATPRPPWCVEVF